MVNAWRRANFWAPPFWSQLEFAYLSAMREPGTEFSAGRVTYLYDGLPLVVVGMGIFAIPEIIDLMRATPVRIARP